MRPSSLCLALPLAGTAFSLLAAAGAAPAAAADQGAMQRQIDTLQDELSRVKAAQAEMKKKQAEAAKGGSGVTLNRKTGVDIESGDGNFSAHVGGRLMVDHTWYDEDKSNLGTGFEVRRARLFVAGRMYRDWKYKVQIDFADEDVAFKDLYLQYVGAEPVTFTVGHFKEPFSLEELTSSKYITFIERAQPNDLVPGRAIGAGAKASGEMWTAAFGVFGEDINRTNGGNEALNEGWDVAGRVTGAIGCASPCVHLGLGARYRDPNGQGARLRQRPESHGTDVRFIDTGTLGFVDEVFQVMPEAAVVAGPFSAQSEFLYTHVGQDGRGPDADFTGWYAFVSYFLTGESRNYDPSDGDFGRVKPKNNLGGGGTGAWEVAARYSNLDLNDGSIAGGEQDIVTLGLNWYANPHIRFMLNLMWVDTDGNATGNAAGTFAGVTPGNDDPFITALRAQVDF